MKLVLLERIEKLGNVGDVVTVKMGYARNYLLPEKKALRATKENLEVYEARKAELAKLDQQRKAEAAKLAKTLEAINVILIRQAAETGMLYGSVTGRDISDALNDMGHKIERRQVDLNIPFKAIGVQSVPLSLHPDVHSVVKVIIARTDAEAQTLLNPPAEKTDAKEVKAEKKEGKTPSGRKKTAKKEDAEEKTEE